MCDCSYVGVLREGLYDGPAPQIKSRSGFPLTHTLALSAMLSVTRVMLLSYSITKSLGMDGASGVKLHVNGYTRRPDVSSACH